MKVTLSFQRQRGGGVTTSAGMYIMSQNDKDNDMSDREVGISELRQENFLCSCRAKTVAENS